MLALARSLIIYNQGVNAPEILELTANAVTVCVGVSSLIVGAFAAFQKMTNLEFGKKSAPLCPLTPVAVRLR